MIVLDETAVAIWYVSYEAPVDALLTMQQLDDHCLLTWRVREHGPDGEVVRTYERPIKLSPIPLAQAVRNARRMFKDAQEERKIQTEWEVIRGARSVQEFGELIALMPHAHARAATPAEAEEMMSKRREAGTR